MNLTHTVIQGDCREVVRTLPPESVDLVVSSPPYAQGLSYEQGLDYDGLFALIADLAVALLPVLKPSAFAIFNFGETTKYTPRTMAQLYTTTLTDAGFIMHSRRIWLKSFAKCGLSGAQTQHTIPAAEFEHIWTFRKPPNAREIHRDKSLSLRGVWSVSEDCLVGKDEHPAAFPPELAMLPMRVWSDPGALVLDPFCGSGSTGVAAVRLNRSFLGIEQDAVYVALAQRLIGGAQPPLLGDDTTDTDPNQHSLFTDD